MGPVEHARWLVVVSACLAACTRDPAPQFTGDATPPAASASLAAPSAATPSATGTVAPTAPTSPSPTAARPPAGPEPGPFVFADLDPDNDRDVGPPPTIPDCASQLQAARIDFRDADVPIRRRGQDIVCGSEQVIRYRKGPAGIRYNSAPLLTCKMALALARFEHLAQAQAERYLGSKVVHIAQMGTYSCRKMQRFALASEHSFVNAIDIEKFRLADGRVIEVESHFGKTDTEPDRAESRFLRTLTRRAFDEGVFSVVLTPFWDRLHRDHLHLDMARYRVDGTR